MQKDHAIKLKAELDMASTMLNCVLLSSKSNLSSEEFEELKKCIGIAMGELAVYKGDLCIKHPFLNKI